MSVTNDTDKNNSERPTPAGSGGTEASINSLGPLQASPGSAEKEPSCSAANSSGSPARPSAGARERPSLASDILHVFVLTSFAVAEPLLDRISRHTVFLEDLGIGRTALWIILIAVALGPPIILSGIELAAARLGAAVRSWIHLGIVFVLIAFLAMPVFRLIPVLDGMSEVGLSIIAAALAGFLYRRFGMARLLVTAASPAIVVFPIVFLFFSPVTKTMFPVPPSTAHRVRVRTPVPVILIVFDEFCGTSLMDDRHEIDAARYPHFRALADEATWYRNATGVHQRTESAVPSLLTGKYPTTKRQPTLKHYPDNLFTLLEGTSTYEMTAFEPYSRLFPPEPEPEIAPRTLREQLATLSATLPGVFLYCVFPSDLPVALPDLPLAWHGIRENRPVVTNKRTGVFRHHWNSGRANQFDRFLSFLEQPGPPPLYFCHIVLPHFPWCYLPSGRRYIEDDGMAWQPRGASGQHYETWGYDELAVSHAYQRYLLQVGHADYLVGRLVERLRELDLYDQSLLIITADHGAAFVAGESRRAPSADTLPDIMSIPFFVKLPRQREGGPSDRNVESIDILPTIADVLGIELPITLDGHSLADPAAPERDKKQFWNDDGRSVVDARFNEKYWTLDRMLHMFGDGSDAGRLFRIGPNSGLVGQEVTNVVAVRESSFSLELVHPRNDAAADSNYMPCYLDGRLRPPPPSPIELAVAVNGTIRAVTRTYTDKGMKDVFTAMLPESSLVPGENEFVIYVVSDEAGRLSLKPATDEPIRITAP